MECLFLSGAVVWYRKEIKKKKRVFGHQCRRKADVSLTVIYSRNLLNGNRINATANVLNLNLLNTY